MLGPGGCLGDGRMSRVGSWEAEKLGAGKMKAAEGAQKAERCLEDSTSKGDVRGEDRGDILGFPAQGLWVVSQIWEGLKFLLDGEI